MVVSLLMWTCTQLITCVNTFSDMMHFGLCLLLVYHDANQMCLSVNTHHVQLIEQWLESAQNPVA